MAIDTNLLFSNAANTATATGATGVKREDESLGWFNIGVTRPDGSFLSLGGIPLSYLKSQKRLSEEQLGAIVQLEAVLNSMAPDTSYVESVLDVQIRRLGVKDPTRVASFGFGASLKS